ncbi:MAG: hypothetical protein KF678_13085 [Phycisphaeraceae bacterium]|nr:hypothetical protein [Phycisphaeraceae bacterium]
MSPPRSPLRERLGVYLLGVAIGCVISGLILMGRHQAKQGPPPSPPEVPQPLPPR